MQIEFAEPAPHLSSFISLYYRIRSDAASFNEIERADIAHLRFMLKGSGHMRFYDGTVGESCHVMLTGPGSAAAHIELSGPIDAVGCSLLPLAWGGGLLKAEARDHADFLCDAMPLLGDSFDGINARLSQAGDIDAMKPILDEAFGAMVQPVNDSIAEWVEDIRQWMASSNNPIVRDLTGGDPSKERQYTRIGNRHYGGPPKAQARKIRALKAAQAIMMNDGQMCDAALEHFYDQPHMIREIKHFTGKSPGKLASPDELLLQLLLDRPYFRELELSDSERTLPPRMVQG